MRAPALAALALFAGCLPGDTRPEPARVELTAVATSEVRDGLVTDDGWTITFDRVAAVLGDVSIEGSDCNQYEQTRYQWLFDFVTAEREKVGLVFGIGTCFLKFHLRTPTIDDTIYGSGGNDDLYETMLALDGDAVVESSRTALLVEGRADKDGETKRFSWAFRRSHQFFDCEDAAINSDRFELVGGQRHDPIVEIRPRELFRDEADDDAAITFGRYAAADLDGDAWITFDELDQVTSTNGVESLAEELYDTLLPRCARLAGGGACDTIRTESYEAD